MSDILIKGMDMPKRCTGCFNSKCLLFFEHTDPNNSRHPNCPLVKLPSHGRLIDADELLKTVEELRDEPRLTYTQFSDGVLKNIKSAPTVLEASNVF